MGGRSIYVNRERPKPGGERRSISVDREAKTVGGGRSISVRETKTGDFCEIKTGEGGRSISVRSKRTGGAIDFCEAADFCCGGDQFVSKERQNGGGFLLQ